jgi:hypothetical protein
MTLATLADVHKLMWHVPKERPTVDVAARCCGKRQPAVLENVRISAGKQCMIATSEPDRQQWGVANA